jgi:hypothetical protein
MIRLRPHRVGKAESLFVANLKPFFDSIGPSATCEAIRQSLLSDANRTKFAHTEFFAV